MNNEVNNEIKENFEKNNKLMFLSLVGVLTLIVAIAGTTYAYFSVTATNNNVITGSSAYDEGALSVVVTQESDGTGKLVPQLDAAIQSAVTGSTGKGSCVDANDNTICKVYSITITNNSNVALNVTGKLELTANSMTNLKWAKGTSATSGFPANSSGPFYPVSTTSLSDDSLTASTSTSGNSKTYYVVIWISETNSSQDDKNDFSGVVTFDGYISGGDGTKVNGISSTIRG